MNNRRFKVLNQKKKWTNTHARMHTNKKKTIKREAKKK